MRFSLTFMFLFVFGNLCHAEGLTATRTSVSDVEYADYNHFFKSGISGGQGVGLSLAYDHLIHPQFLLGVSGSTIGDSNYSSGGDLDSGNYYDESYEYRSTQAQINGTYFFRENGYARWGFLTKAGVGYAWNKTSANYKRYDRDPAFFRFFGEKRLQDDVTVSEDWGNFIGNLGVYYQFAWNFKATSRVGHILQLGTNYLYGVGGRSIGYTKPNNDSKSYKTNVGNLALEVSYTIGF